MSKEGPCATEHSTHVLALCISTMGRLTGKTGVVHIIRFTLC
jgi:hypothetical protein